MNDYNIEFGHIYIDQQPGSEQTQAIEILKSTIAKLNRAGKSHVTTMLIDDISPEGARLDIGGYTAATSSNVPLDFIFLESTLGIFKDTILADIPETEKIHGRKNQSLYIKDSGGNRVMILKPDGTPTCSLYIAIWFLGRLGIYSDISRWGINLHNKEFAARKIITILSEGYKLSDEQALAILEKTPHWNTINDRIDFIYFQV